MKWKMISLRFSSFTLLALVFLSHALSNSLVYARQARKINHLKATSLEKAGRSFARKVFMQDEGFAKEGLGGRKITVVNGNLKSTLRDGTTSSKLSEGGNKTSGSREKRRFMKHKEDLVAISADYRGPKSNPSRHH